jgi:hypothetical protein
MGILISSLVFMPPQNSIGEVYGELDKDKIIKLKTRLHNDRIPAYHLDKKVPVNMGSSFSWVAFNLVAAQLHVTSVLLLCC